MADPIQKEVDAVMVLAEQYMRANVTYAYGAEGDHELPIQEMLAQQDAQEAEALAAMGLLRAAVESLARDAVAYRYWLGNAPVQRDQSSGPDAERIARGEV